MKISEKLYPNKAYPAILDLLQVELRIYDCNQVLVKTIRRMYVNDQIKELNDFYRELDLPHDVTIDDFVIHTVYDEGYCIKLYDVYNKKYSLELNKHNFVSNLEYDKAVELVGKLKELVGKYR